MKSEKNWLEWTVFAVGCVLTVGTLVLLGYQAWMPRAGPPQLAVALGTPEPAPEGVVVPVTVTNRGGQTAENVEVVVAARTEGRQVASGAVTLAFVPKNARRAGRVVFTGDLPPQPTFVVQSLGYQLP